MLEADVNPVSCAHVIPHTGRLHALDPHANRLMLQEEEVVFLEMPP